jgi:5-(aminomethyl)-3-furanmethanol phosphate kinase
LIDAMPTRGLMVLKLGGSHAVGPHLRYWLAHVRSVQTPMVLVPGGGPFADAVRLTQRHMGFDDHVAHHLALIAMEQYGQALCGLEPRLSLANSLQEVQDALERHQVPVWAPVRMAGAAGELPASWELTSDSLAAWFAGLIGAADLVLVKHVPFSSSPIGVSELVAQGVVDSMFPEFLARSGARAWLAGPGPEAALTAIVPAADSRSTLQQPL